jgi:hypothetical protein
LALLCRLSQSASRWCQFAGFMMVTCTALVLVVPAIDFFYQFAQPRPGNPDSQILSVIAIPVVLIAMIFELLRIFWANPVKEPLLDGKHDWINE